MPKHSRIYSPSAGDRRESLGEYVASGIDISVVLGPAVGAGPDTVRERQLVPGSATGPAGLGGREPTASGGQGTSNVVGIMVRHDWGWPREAVSAVGPDPSQDAAGACLKSPFFDEVRHRATYDLNKELFDDLEGGLTIVVGRGYSK